MKRRAQDALDAVARHFSATWERGDGSPDAYVTVAGTRIAVDVVSLKPRRAARDGETKPRLRFDRVVLALVQRLRMSLREVVPAGRAVIVTVTAPIRLPGRTAAELDARIRSLLARRSRRAEIRDTIHGNRIRVRVVARASKVIGLVHNPDTDADMILDIAQSLLQHVGMAAEKRAPARFSGARWLVLVHAGRSAPLETYQQIYAQLSLPNAFRKILLAFADGRVESLT